MSGLTEATLVAALNACWTHGIPPNFMRIGFWERLMLDEFNERGHCQRTIETYKGLKRAEQSLARRYRWQPSTSRGGV